MDYQTYKEGYQKLQALSDKAGKSLTEALAPYKGDDGRVGQAIMNMPEIKALKDSWLISDNRRKQFMTLIDTKTRNKYNRQMSAERREEWARKAKENA